MDDSQYLDGRTVIVDEAWATMDSCRHCGDVYTIDDGCECRKARDITDPDRWPLTWATIIEQSYQAEYGDRYLDRYEHADVYDALESVRGARFEAAERLECSVGAFGYEATPLSIEDCRWYRRRAGHEMGDLGYGRYTREEWLRDSDDARG